MTPCRSILACLCLAGLACAPACVTESVVPVTGRSTGIQLHPSSSTAAANASKNGKVTPSGVTGTLPDGPLATPATASHTISSRVEVGVVPLGTLVYDGEALPLVSPDGQFIAVQDGEPPSWEAILAEAAAQPPQNASISLRQTDKHDTKPLPLNLPPGLLLGRSCDDRGFLVEAPQSDGSRWIGRVAWVGGNLEWLVRGPLVSAHAVLTPCGELVYTSRPVESDAANLVIQGKNGAQSVRTPAEGTYAFPMCTGDPDTVYVMHLTPKTMELEAIRLDRGPDGLESNRVPTFGATIARRGMTPKGDSLIAYQIASTAAPCLPLQTGQTPDASAPLTVFHPRLGGVAEFKLDSSNFEPLAPKSISAVPAMDASRPGYFCTTPDGLIFWPTTHKPGDDTFVRVLAAPYVARRVRGTPESLMLVGPVKGKTDQLEVVRMVIGPGAGQPRRTSAVAGASLPVSFAPPYRPRLSPDPAQLEKRVQSCTPPDRRRLLPRLYNLPKNPQHLDPFLADLAQAESRVAERRTRLPKITFPDDLPVSQRREEIATAIQDNQVVVICGETGSGKTTQLPKICLELGRGIAGMIGHTQPRRIAARSVATRIADELGGRVGGAVGYKVRFGDKTGPETLIKVMTDGILLAETQHDRALDQYDTLIIDEAHERSLNIDFLLGYVKQLLLRRKDLKVIITSATIDPQRFAEHFATPKAAGGPPVPAPIVMVSGRTYPVEVLYRPPPAHEELDELDDDMQRAILHAVDEAASYGDGDILVFLSGEREIRETAELLSKHHVPGSPSTAILPLYAKLSSDEQMRVFQPHTGRRIVLSTNVAETSLTVPGIRFVVDVGFARINRYAPRTKVQRLEIEPISKASADQRKGRCGRLGPGVCVRLYTEQDYLDRPQFTDPEIVRANLASVILQMESLRLGAVDRFPFLDPPNPQAVRDGYETLHELGAMDEKRQLQPIGRDLARLPIDPRIGRMILASRKENCLDEALIIAAALSVQDPRDRPMEKADQADQAHAPFKDPASDFASYLRLWSAYKEQKRHLSSSKLRRWCKDNFLSFVRLREWEDIHNQLAELVIGMSDHPPAKAESRGGAGSPSHASPQRHEVRICHGPTKTQDTFTPRPELIEGL